jgi:hypothetical protein
MEILLFCFILVVNSTFGAIIPTFNAVITRQVTCDGGPFNCGGEEVGANTDVGGNIFVGSPNVSALAFALRDHSASASVTFQDDYVLTVTDGPAKGFFEVEFGGEVIRSGQVAGSFFGQTNGGGERTSFKLGVPVGSTLFLNAEADASGNGDVSSSAAIGFVALDFFDASMNPVNVSFTLVEGAVPEPSVAFSVVCGLLLLVFLAPGCQPGDTPRKTCVKHSVNPKESHPLAPRWVLTFAPRPRGGTSPKEGVINSSDVSIPGSSSFVGRKIDVYQALLGVCAI